MIKAVLFDLDGVLVDSEPVNIEAGVRSFMEQNITLTHAERKLIIGRHPADYPKVFGKKHFDEKTIVKRHAFHYNRLYANTAKPLPYAKEFVHIVIKRGFKTALVTASEKSVVSMAFKKIRLGRVFDRFITFEDCKKRKPAPDVYLLAAKRLHVKPRECVVMEDSIVGIEAAKRAGMKCIAVTNSFPASHLRKADLIVKNLNDRRIWKILR